MSSGSKRWLRPFSMITTAQPARVSTSATVAPPGPEPMMMASASPLTGRAPPAHGRSRLRHLGVGVAPRLHVALHIDVRPPDAVAVAAVLGRAVHPFAAVLPQQLPEGVVVAQAAPLLLAVGLGEVGTQRGQPFAVALLEPDD